MGIKICSICHKPFTGHGNNAEPVNNGTCCYDCNSDIVVPARFANVNFPTFVADNDRPTCQCPVCDNDDTEQIDDYETEIRIDYHCSSCGTDWHVTPTQIRYTITRLGQEDE